ncbi:MAG: zf-TFIIB domain-containing protein [Paraglaciecola sp.]|uniref:zf-TFIIB domain-containing protein n=1 Tax=Paraglaciecola sp. TaxID=1920173 RepID=UPI00329959AF
MNCTACNEGTLNPSFIDGLFRAHTCSNCGGDWILIEDYAAWRERHSDYEFAKNIQFEEEQALDNKHAILCPVTHTIMRKFKISAHNSHRLDYSSRIGGLWLDKGEWELLSREGLAGSLNALVTDAWQRKIREDSAKEHFSDIYSDRFGDDVYNKIKDIRAWLQSQPHKADLRAYLMAEDPYSAKR